MNSQEGIGTLASSFIALTKDPEYDFIYKDLKESINLYMPSLNQLERLLKITYQASLKTEEGRRVTCKISIGIVDKGELIKFDNPRDFNVDELVRIAPVIDIDNRNLVVDINYDKPKIIGIDEPGLRTEVLDLFNQFNIKILNNIEISILAPGHIKIKHGFLSLDFNGEKVNQKLSLLSSSKFANIIRNNASKTVVLKRSELLNESDRIDIKEQEKMNDIIAFSINGLFRFWDQVIQNIQKEGHGGTLLFLSDDESPEDHNLTIKYPIQFNDICETVKAGYEWGYMFYQVRFCNYKLNEESANQLEIPLCNYLVSNKKIERLVNIVSSFSLVDGAVLLDSKFNILGFGSRIPLNTDSATKEIKFTNFSNGEFVHVTKGIDTLGLRHQSAAEFVSQGTNRVALVISQDGNLRIFEKEEGQSQKISCDEYFEAFGTVLTQNKHKNLKSKILDFFS